MRPKSLILDLLSASDPIPLPAASFLEAARVFKLKENTLRVTLGRLVAGGTLDASGAGTERRYTLSSRSQILNRHILAAQSLHAKPWRGEWISIIAWAPGAGRAVRDRLRVVLRVLKLANLQPGVWIRPDNLDLSFEDVIEEFGFKKDVVWMRGALRHGEEESVLAGGLFNVARHAKAIERACRDLGASMARLDRLSPGRALAETFAVGGRAIKVMFEDPLLPDALLPRGWRGDALRKLFAEYDRMGRLHWQRALGVPLGDRPAPAIGARSHSAIPILRKRGRSPFSERLSR